MGFRVVFFNRSFYPDVTATGQLLYELCEDLIKDYDCQVTVISGKPLIRDSAHLMDKFWLNIIKRENLKRIEILRVNSTVFSPRSFLSRIANYLTYFFLSFIASFKLKKPDIVVTLTDPPIIGLIGRWVALRFNIPFIISVRDVFPEAARGLKGSHHKIMDFLLDKLNRFCLKKTARIVALGNTMCRRLEEKGIIRNKISIIPDWVDTTRIFPVPKKNTFSLAYNLEDFFVVMYAGNLGASSGVEIMVEGARLLKDYKDILFVFIGEGIIKDKLITLAKNYNLENTKFFPYQPQDMLSYSFSSADIFIIPLKKGLAGYSLPSKIYTILASARPYVACVEEESEIVEITRRFECGLLAKPEDPLDMAEKILSFYKHQELRLRMGENARKAAIFFDRTIGVKAYYELFKELLKNKETL